MAFQILEVSVLSKSLIFVKRGVWLVFHQAGSSQNEQNLSLQEKTSESFLWANNTFVQKPCSFQFFSILEENCGADLSRWVSHTFLQKRCSFKSFSILEENCVPTSLMKHLNVRLLLANAVKSGRWVSHTLLQKSCFFKKFSAFQKKIVLPTSLMEHLNVRLLLANAVKSCRWVSYTFLQKRWSFKSFSISEENCAADIINETFKCKTFVGKCCKKRPLSKSCLPTKAKSFQSFLNSSIIFKKFLCL